MEDVQQIWLENRNLRLQLYQLQIELGTLDVSLYQDVVLCHLDHDFDQMQREDEIFIHDSIMDDRDFTFDQTLQLLEQSIQSLERAVEWEEETLARDGRVKTWAASSTSRINRSNEQNAASRKQSFDRLLPNQTTNSSTNVLRWIQHANSQLSDTSERFLISVRILIDLFVSKAAQDSIFWDNEFSMNSQVLECSAKLKELLEVLMGQAIIAPQTYIDADRGLVAILAKHLAIAQLDPFDQSRLRLV